MNQLTHKKLDSQLRSALNFPREEKEKKSFWASDFNRNAFDIYHKFKGTKPTNPPDEEKQGIFIAGKAIEEAICHKLTKVKAIVPMEDEFQERVDMTRGDIRITGYMDAVASSGEPIEIKSIYHAFQDKDVAKGVINENYLGQLCIYMDYTNKDTGFIIVMNRGTGQRTVFQVNRLSGRRFVCIGTPNAYRETIIDLDKEYERWTSIYKNNVLKDIEPESDAVYKYNIEDIDWTELPVKKIGDARNGYAVVGDWGAIYSDYKDLIISKEAKKHGKTYETYIGYSDQEIDRIKKITEGYSTWSKIGFTITDADREQHKGKSNAEIIIAKTEAIKEAKKKEKEGAKTKKTN